MARHVMVDLETLGLSPDSVIVSIGAVVFTKDGIESEGYWPLSLNQPDRHVDLGTVQWWMRQSDDARSVFNAKGTAALTGALGELEKAFCDGTLFWSNGANFDEVLLANAYRKAGRPTPWNYKNVRCYRTMCALFGDVAVPNVGTTHNALDDARYQANVLIEIMRQKGIELK